MAILFAAILIVFLTTYIIAVDFSQERHRLYSVYLEEGCALRKEYQDIINLIYESHIRFFTYWLPGQLTGWNPNLNTTEIVDYYTKTMDSKIASILA